MSRIQSFLSFLQFVMSVAVLILAYRFVNYVSDSASTAVGTVANATGAAFAAITTEREDIHDHRVFLKDYGEKLKEEVSLVSSMAFGRQMRQLSQHTATSVNIISSHIKLLRTMDLQEYESDILGKAQNVRDLMREVIYDTHTVIKRSKSLFSTFLESTRSLASDIEHGRFEHINSRLSEVLTHIDEVLRAIRNIQTRLGVASDDTRALTELTENAMIRISLEADQAQGKKAYPLRTIVLSSAIIGLSTFVAAASSPLVVGVALTPGAAPALGALAGVATMEIGVSLRDAADERARELSQDADTLKEVALSTYSLMEGIKAFNVSLTSLKTAVSDSAPKVRMLKRFNVLQHEYEFKDSLDHCVKSFEAVVDEYDYLESTWFDDDVSV